MNAYSENCSICCSTGMIHLIHSRTARVKGKNGKVVGHISERFLFITIRRLTGIVPLCTRYPNETK